MRIGLALGGGGIRGLAHVCVLEHLDRLQMQPSIIAGCSIGAIIGALYASGQSGKTIRELIDTHTIRRKDSWQDILHKGPEILKWVFALTPTRRRGGLLNVDRLLNQLLGSVAKADFAELEIPLLVVATDFRTAEEVVLSAGPIRPAVRASVAVPGLFSPIEHSGRLLVDGGLVNQLPYDLVFERSDITIAVDKQGRGGAPAQSLKPHGAGAGIEVKHVRPVDQTAQYTENCLTSPIRGGTDQFVELPSGGG